MTTLTEWQIEWLLPLGGRGGNRQMRGLDKWGLDKWVMSLPHMWGVGGMEMIKHYVTLYSSEGSNVEGKKTVLIKRKVGGPEVSQVNLLCYTTLDGIKSIPILWQGYAMRHTSAWAHGEVFDVYFWKKGIYYSWEGDGVLVYFFAVLSVFSEFYSNQAKEDDSLLSYTERFIYMFYIYWCISKN